MIKGPVIDVTSDPTRQGYPVVDVTPVLSSTDRAKFNTWIGAKAGLTI